MAKKTLAEYPAHFQIAWDVAAKGKLELQLGAKGTAVNLKAQLYGYRKRLREHSLALAAPYELIDLDVVERDGSWWVIVRQIEWKRLVMEQAKENGIEVHKPQVAPVVPLPVEATPTGEDMHDELLRALGMTAAVDK